ncbi:carboxylesterase [Colletotrichum graminicola]|uniref:Carboxylic ester hydrolase n=1 Tax=Colletotrichum graminicola (strain M1.001 / M2 / FGSC 10212) TaxID=645133 RepID=E3QNZ7_COLGM|nr:carboxylesterase [Colletotrichum graminicola M1.001]EFQ32585.1 carboxylesterase [Colletotrichum graminicola M1.001]WDK18307.1 carboxylesterase [Colletotrichum graminicola]
MRLKSYLLALLPLLAVAVSADGPTVDLSYARYQGTYNSTLKLNIFRGIRYAAPPTGKLRWQLPQEPEDITSNKNSNTSDKATISATSNPPHCPWSRRSLQYPKTASEESSLAAFDIFGDEDCLFLNVFAPAGAEDLPVVVWIHGGGYSLDSAANYDFSTQITTNENKYLAVVIQYRLGAFGFLSSADVVANGVANVGLHDMLLALRWVQKHICKFGGNPSKVTVAGQSSGAGAILVLATTNEAEGLFDGVIASSPYLTTQPQFDGVRPTKAYHSLADRVGCSLTNETSSLFACMQNVDSITLQNASDWVSTQGLYGHWEWRPVIDGKLLTNIASRHLGSRTDSVKGVRLLTSNVADEGPYFTWQNITSQTTFVKFLTTYYPKLTASNVTEVLAVYTQKYEDFIMANSKDVNNTDPGFDTDGRNAPFATTMSNYAMGWQQVANNLYAEATFVCPSHWLANAYATKSGGRAWRYQFSASPAYHGFDVGTGSDYDVLLAPVDTPNSTVPRSLRRALQTAWGDFIVTGAPTLRDTGPSTTFWPQWKEGGQGAASILNANVTGGVLVENDSSFDGMVTLHITSHLPGGFDYPPLQAVFEIADGDTWEDGRGKRCSMLAELSPWMNE